MATFAPTGNRLWIVTVTLAIVASPLNAQLIANSAAPACGGFFEEDAKSLAEIERAGSCTAGWSVTTIISNGPSENRFDLVVLGDGFVNDPTNPSNNLGRYGSLTQQHIDRLLLTHPYPEYANYLNVHRVDVISNDPCIDYPLTGLECDTALDFSYGDDVSRPRRCILGNAGKMFDAADCAPDVDGILGLANAAIHGGCASGTRSHVAAKASTGLQTTVHELGHSIGRLADEYVTFAAPFPGPEPGERNVSTFNATEQTQNMTKWYRWLNEPGVNTYEGARYYATGIFRSTVNSVMRSSSSFTFGPVNSEGIILKIYDTVSTIENVTPPDDPDAAYDPFTVFTVDVLQPLSQTVEVQWFVDDVAIPGATGPTFQIPNPRSLPQGVYDVTVRAIDQTPLVRDEEARNARMADTRSWTVTVGGACLLNSHCSSEIFYCEKETGDCDGEGVCRKKPTNCPQYLVFNPICGCDGEEYAGECDAHQAGVNVADLNECPCRSNEDCVFWGFCLRENCLPFTMGECSPPAPVQCSPDPNPVCGCDGLEYLNECTAHANRVNVNPGATAPDCEIIGSCCTGGFDCTPSIPQSDCEAQCGHFIPFQQLCSCFAIPKGACCLPGGTCEELATQSRCDCLGGDFLGPGTTCNDCR